MATREMECRDFFERAKARAERHLAEFGNTPVVDQFVAQRVGEVVRQPIHIQGYLRIGVTNNHSFFSIVIDQFDEPTEMWMSIGHEFAHTFELYDGATFLVPPYPTVHSGDLCREREDFCEDFAHRWVERVRVEDDFLQLVLQKNPWRVPLMRFVPWVMIGTVSYQSNNRFNV